MSCGYRPRGPVSMIERLRSQANISCASGRSSSSASSGSVVVSTWAQASRARRCCGLGTVSTRVARRAVDHAAQLRRRRRLATLGGDVGHQGEGEGVAAGEGERTRVVRAERPRGVRGGSLLSSRLRFVRWIACIRPFHPGSVRQATEGGSRPASTATASAASEGNSSSRSQRSNGVSRSVVSTSSSSRRNSADRLPRVLRRVDAALRGDLGEVRRGDRRQLPRIEADDKAPQLAAQVGVPSEQRRLADAAWPEDEQDGAVARALQQGAKGGHLLGPPNELPSPLRGHPLRQCTGHADLRT